MRSYTQLPRILEEDSKYAEILCTDTVCKEAVCENIMAEYLSQYMKNIKPQTLKLKKTKILSRYISVCACYFLTFHNFNKLKKKQNLKT